MSDLKLFRIEGDKAEELEGGPVGLERRLQKVFEANLEELLGVRFLASEYSTTNGGRIDTLGIDETFRPVIIEYKRDRNQNVINQGLFYLDWLMDHREAFSWLVLQKIGKDTAEAVEWSAPRLICIANDFTKYDEHAINQMNHNIELIRYKSFDERLLVLELLTTVTSQKSARTSAQPSDSAIIEVVPENGAELTPVEKSFRDASPEVIELFNDLRDYILEIGEDVTETELKTYTAYRRLKNFATVNINPRHRNLFIQLRLNPTEVGTEPGFTEDVSQKGTWGTGDLRVTVSDHGSLERAKPLILKSYEAS